MEPLLLDSRAVRTCAHKIRLDHTGPQEAKVFVELSAVEQQRYRQGREFEDRVVARLLAELGDDARDLRSEPRDEAAEETEYMMRREVPVIIGGRLPDDLDGARKGIPDLLIHVGDGKYLPGDIKHHPVTKERGPRSPEALTSPPDDPAAFGPDAGRSPLGKDLADDLGQLAHYTRMLQALGRHPGGTPYAALIGKEAGEELRLAWYDLSARLGVTTEPADPETGSVLDLYDARLDLRVRAAAGQAHTVPVHREGCDACPWLARCRADAGEDDASFALASTTMKPRDWLALRGLGVTTTDELAALDVGDDRLVRRFALLSSAPKQAAKKLAAARQIADMVAAGEMVRRTTAGPLVVPAADVEVDIDYEWGTDGLVYLWAGTVRRGPSLAAGEQGAYYPFYEWDELTPERERELAEAFVDWLRAIIAKAQEKGRTVAIYHYSHPERTHLARVLGEDAVADVLDHFEDLLPFVRRNFIGAHGLGIKKVAPAFGFAWKDDDPGGLQSQDWLLKAQATPDRAEAAELHTRILRYNEDDVRATAAIRDGMRAQHPAAA